MSTVLGDHKPSAAEQYPHLPQPQLSSELLSHPPPALILSPLSEASACPAGSFAALGSSCCVCCWRGLWARWWGLCSKEHPGVERLSPAPPSELAEPVAEVPCAAGHDGVGESGMARCVLPCAPKCSHQPLGSTAALLVQPHLQLSAGMLDPAASERHVLITWFIQTKGDYAASAVAVNDACASRTEATCCGYISTEVLHKRIKSNKEIPVAQLERDHGAGDAGGRNQQSWAVFSLRIAITHLNGDCRHSLCCLS